MIRLFVTGLLLLFSLPVLAAPLPSGGAGKRQVPVGYTAVNGERLEACFDQGADSVTLRLPDAAVITLPAALSASGARYSKGSMTFWEHQGVGRFFVDEQLTFEGKAAATGYGTGAESRLLIQSGVTADGRKIAYPSTDKAEVTAMLVELAPGAETGWHKHTAPVYAYLLSGTIEVELEDGRQFSYRDGQAILEVVETFHIGRNKGTEAVRLAVFYAGVSGVPNVVRKQPGP